MYYQVYMVTAGAVFTAMTDDNGAYSLLADAGTYDCNIHQNRLSDRNRNWSSSS